MEISKHQDNQYTMLPKNSLLWALLLIPFVKPSYFESVESLDMAFNYWKVVALLILILFYCINFLRERKITADLVCTSILGIVLIISTIINEGEPTTAFNTWVTVVGFVALMNLMIKTEPKLLFSALLPVMEILVYANLISILLFPDGLFRLVRVTGWYTDSCWLLGIRNGQIAVLIPTLTVSIIYVQTRGKQIKTLIRSGMLISAIVTTIVLIDSGGATAALIFFPLFFLIPRLVKKTRVVSFKTACLFNLGFFVFVVLLRLQNVFAFFIEGVLQKDLTLTGRTDMWDNAFEWIMKSPVYGWGYEDHLVLASKINNIAAVTTCHNTLIDITYKGGILAVMCFVALLIIISIRLEPWKKDRRCSFFCYAVLLFFITAQTEGFLGIYLFMMLSIAYGLPELLRKTSSIKLKFKTR